MRNKHLSSNTERMEMELLHVRAAEINGLDSGDEEGSGIYKVLEPKFLETKFAVCLRRL